MKALSIQPYWATLTLQAAKMVEWRSWKTGYRGDLLICASSGPNWAGSICKHALCIVDLVDVEPFRKKHLEPACMDELPEPRGYAWVFDNVRFVEPFEVKGKLHIYEVDDDLVKVLPEGKSTREFAEKWYKPLMRWEDKYVKREEVEAVWADWMVYLDEFDAETSRR